MQCKLSPSNSNIATSVLLSQRRCAQLSARGTLAMTLFKSCIKTAHRLTGHQPCVRTGTLNTGALIGIILRMLGKVR
jgi:hypothetical protein